MSQADGKPGPDDPLSATGMFRDGFRPSEEPPQDEVLESFLRPEGARPLGGVAEPAAPGEFTRMFGASHPVASGPFVPSPAPLPPAPPKETPKPSWEEATRIFVPRAAPPPAPRERPVVNPVPAVNPPRMKGFSSPGASDSASDEGSFTQIFRTISGIPAAPPQVRPIQPLPPQVSSSAPAAEKAEWPKSSAKNPGATELLRALSTADPSPVERNANSVFAAVESGSVTNWMKKLSEHVEPPAAADTPPAVTPQAPAASVPGEYTRIMTADTGKAAAIGVPVAPRVPMPAFEPPRVAAPNPALPAVAAPPSKLQEMLPILLVLNCFLLVVLILLVVFVLMRK